MSYPRHNIEQTRLHNVYMTCKHMHLSRKSSNLAKRTTYIIYTRKVREIHAVSRIRTLINKVNIESGSVLC